MTFSFYWHIHHETLCEGTYDIQERIDYIKEKKNSSEVPIRLKWMNLVLHPERLPSEWKEADQKREEAYQKRKEAYQKWKAEIEALHKEEHPGCPWNGRTIFP